METKELLELFVMIARSIALLFLIGAGWEIRKTGDFTKVNFWILCAIWIVLIAGA